MANPPEKGAASSVELRGEIKSRVLYSREGFLTTTKPIISDGNYITRERRLYLRFQYLLLADRLAAGVRKDDVAKVAAVSGLEEDARQSQTGQFGAVPGGQAANVDGRIGGQIAEGKLFAARRPGHRHVVDGERRLLAAPFDGDVVPVAVAQIAADRQDLRPGSEVVPQPQSSFHQFQFEKVKFPAVVRVDEQAVGLRRPEFQLQSAVQSGVPLAHLGVRVLRSFQRERRRSGCLPPATRRPAEHGQPSDQHRPKPFAHCFHHGSLSSYAAQRRAR